MNRIYFTQSPFVPAVVKLYPENASEKLGFGEVVARLAALCHTDEGRATALELAPVADADAVLHALAQAREAKRLLDEGHALPVNSLPPVEQHLALAAIEGTYLEALVFLSLKRWLTTVRGLVLFLHTHKAHAPTLAKWLETSNFDTGLAREIDGAVTPEGAIRPDASPGLRKVRERLADQTHLIRKQLEGVLARARDQGWTEATELALRNGRLVVPLKAAAKHRVQGFVHDMSSSGQTLFVEPVEALAANNRIRELLLEEQREIVRILTALTDRLRPLVPHFRHFVRFVAEMDVLQAKARLAQLLRATLPEMRPAKQVLQIAEGRHPLLALKLGPEAVVPLNLRLDARQRILLVSGPNAGGKSVALKTAGLLQLMLQAGLLAPVHADSVFPVLDKIFVDIGDGQSLQNDLSTYTSHLRHMRQMLAEANANALVLIDEFGTGTDPLFGGPIAEALLERLVALGPLGIITTHYSNLKEYAEANEATVNGAMAFDHETLGPTYRLLQGEPGSSFALEIAARAGIPAEVLQRAKALMNQDRLAADQLLAELKARERELLKQQAFTEKREAFLAELITRNQARQAAAEEQAATLLDEAEAQAQRLLAESNRRIEEAIREIKTQQAEREQTRQIRHELKAAVQTQLAEARKLKPKRKKRPAEAQPLAGDIAVGDTVRLDSSGTTGTVLSVEGPRARLAVGQLQLTAKLANLQKVSATPQGPQTRRQTRLLNPDPVQAAVTELDIRGLFVEDALGQVNKFMDAAILAGLDRLTILHGKGSGALRTAVRGHLRRNFPQVRSLESAVEEAGGDGLTLVAL